MSDNFYKFSFIAILASFIFLARYDSGLKIPLDENLNQSNIVSLESSPSVFVLPRLVSSTKMQEGGDFRGFDQSLDYENESLKRGVFGSYNLGSQIIFKKISDEVPPRISVQSALIADLLSGQNILEIELGKRWPIASITKLVSAAVVSNNIPMHATSVVPVGLLGGVLDSTIKFDSVYTARDLMLTMLLESSNLAAEVLAINFKNSSRISGREAFLEEMNEVVGEWGMRETFLDDPTGLSPLNQSTVSDLKILSRRIYSNYPEILGITKRNSFLITDISSGKKTNISNINLFAGHDYFIGGKTGFTDEAGGNLLSIFEYQNRPVVIIILGTADRFRDTEKLFNWFKRNFSS